MAGCKVKIKVDVCGESALDQVTRLVVGYTDDKGATCSPLPLKTACKKVAEDFNKENKNATVRWQTLRQSYHRANKSVTCNTSKGATCSPSKDKSGTCPASSKKSKVTEIPMVKEAHKPIYTTIYTMVDAENSIQPEVKNEDMVVNVELDALKAELKKSKEAVRNLILSKNKENTVPDFNPPANFTPPTSSSPAVENDRVVELEAELKELVANYQKDMQYQESKLEELKAENEQLRKQLNLKPKQIDDKEFTRQYVEKREAKRAMERAMSGMNPDGTPKK